MNVPGGAPGLSARQRDILSYARKRGEVQVEPLAEAFEVTPQTIRRDLNQLRRLGLLQRVHGGAIAHDGVANLGYEARRRLAAGEKAAIGARAAELIPHDSSLFLNIGTTTEQVAKHLIHHAGLLVITNNINVVNDLLPCENIQIMTAGGVVRREDGGIVGNTTVDFIEQFKVDYAVIGASAIDQDGAILDYDPREVSVARAIISNARSILLVADSMKFQRSAPMRIGNISQVDYFITDQRPPQRFCAICREHQVRIEVAFETDSRRPGRHGQAL